MSELKRHVRFIPAFHRVDEGYGVGGVELYFSVVGEKGAVCVNMMTGWMLSQTHAWWKSRGITPRPQSVEGGCVSIHSVAPTERGAVDCDLLGGKCYDGGTYYNYATEFAELLVRKGDDAVFDKLEEEYRERFSEDTQPPATGGGG
jgi:hypothetical protein